MNIDFTRARVQNGRWTTNVVVHAFAQMTAVLQVIARRNFKVLLRWHLKVPHSPRDSVRPHADSRHTLVWILLLEIPVMYRYGFAMHGQYLKKPYVTMRRQQELTVLLSLSFSLSKMLMRSRMHWPVPQLQVSPLHPVRHRQHRRDSRQRVLWSLSVRWSRENGML